MNAGPGSSAGPVTSPATPSEPNFGHPSVQRSATPRHPLANTISSLSTPSNPATIRSAAKETHTNASIPPSASASKMTHVPARREATYRPFIPRPQADKPFGTGGEGLAPAGNPTRPNTSSKTPSNPSGAIKKTLPSAARKMTSSGPIPVPSHLRITATAPNAHPARPSSTIPTAARTTNVAGGLWHSSQPTVATKSSNSAKPNVTNTAKLPVLLVSTTAPTSTTSHSSQTVSTTASSVIAEKAHLIPTTAKPSVLLIASKTARTAPHSSHTVLTTSSSTLAGKSLLNVPARPATSSGPASVVETASTRTAIQPLQPTSVALSATLAGPGRSNPPTSPARPLDPVRLQDSALPPVIATGHPTSSSAQSHQQSDSDKETNIKLNPSIVTPVAPDSRPHAESRTTAPTSTISDQSLVHPVTGFLRSSLPSPPPSPKTHPPSFERSVSSQHARETHNALSTAATTTSSTNPTPTDVFTRNEPLALGVFSETPRKRVVSDDNDSPRVVKRQKQTITSNENAEPARSLNPTAARIMPVVVDMTWLDDDAAPFIPEVPHKVKVERVEPGDESFPARSDDRPATEADFDVWNMAYEKIEQSRTCRLRALIETTPGYIGCSEWGTRWTRQRQQDLAKRFEPHDTIPPLVGSRMFLRRNVRASMSGKIREGVETLSRGGVGVAASEQEPSHARFDAFHASWEDRESNIHTARTDRYLTVPLTRIVAIDNSSGQRVPLNLDRQHLLDGAQIEVCSADKGYHKLLHKATFAMVNFEIRPSGSVAIPLFRKKMKNIGNTPKLVFLVTLLAKGEPLKAFISAVLEPVRPDGTYEPELPPVVFPILGQSFHLELGERPQWCADPMRPVDPLPRKVVESPANQRSRVKIRYDGVKGTEVEGWRCGLCENRDVGNCKTDAELAVHFAIVHGKGFWVEENARREWVDDYEVVKLTLNAGVKPLPAHTLSLQDRLVAAFLSSNEPQPAGLPEPDLSLPAEAEWDDEPTRPAYTADGMPAPFMRKRVNQWTKWSCRIEPGTLADLMPALDEIWNGGSHRHALLAQEETVIWTRHHISPQHRFAACCWNRWVDQHGPVPAIGRGQYFADFVRTYGPIMDRAQLTTEVGDTLHVFWKDRYLTLDEYLAAMAVWHEVSDAHERASSKRGVEATLSLTSMLSLA